MSETFVRTVLEVAARNCWSALDVGSGVGKFRAHVRKCATIDPAHDPPYSDFHIRGDALDTIQGFGTGEYDLVYCLDVIEHLDKLDGYKLLDQMERVAKRRVLVFTPHGWRPQESNDPWNVHRSGWKAEEFRARGYTTAICDFDYTGTIESAAALFAWLEH